MGVTLDCERLRDSNQRVVRWGWTGVLSASPSRILAEQVNLAPSPFFENGNCVEKIHVVLFLFCFLYGLLLHGNEKNLFYMRARTRRTCMCFYFCFVVLTTCSLLLSTREDVPCLLR